MITPLFLHLEIAGICSEAVLLYFFHHQCQQIRVWLQVYNMNLHWTAWNYVTQSRCLDRNNQWTTKLCHFYTYVCASVFSIHITDKHTYILIVTFLNIDDHFDLLRYIYIYIFAGIGTQILFWNIAISRRRRRYCFSPFFHPAVLAAGTETSWKEITRRTWFHETRRRTWMICNRNRNIEIQIESVPAETEITLYSDGLGFLYPCDRWPFLDLRLRAGWLSLSHCMHWMIRLPSICAGSSWTTNSPKNHGQWSTFFFGKNRFAIAGKWTLYILVLLPPDVGCGDWHPLPHMPRWDCHVFHSGFHVDRWHAATTFFQFWGPNRVQGDFVANSVVTVVTSSFSTLDIWSNPEIYPGIIHAHASCHAISKIKPFLACQAQMSSARAPPPRSGVSVSGSGERYLLDRMISCWLFVVYICRR